MKEPAYRIKTFPGGMSFNKDGTITVRTLIKEYGYWGNLVGERIEKRIWQRPVTNNRG